MVERGSAGMDASLRERERERERDPYFSVVTGTHYGTKTPPGLQPTNPCAGDMTRMIYLHGFPSMVFKVRNMVWNEALCVSLLFMLVVVVFLLDETDWKVGSGRSGVRVVGLWVSAALNSTVHLLLRGGRYRTARAFCFWKALHPLTNLARASIPFLFRRLSRVCPFVD